MGLHDATRPLTSRGPTSVVDDTAANQRIDVTQGNGAFRPLAHIVQSCVGAWTWVLVPAVFLGLLVVYAGQGSQKWLLALVLLVVSSVVVIYFRSVSRACLALLILSLAMNVKINPLYSDAYSSVRPGIPITLSALCLAALYGVWCLEGLTLGRTALRFFPSVTIPLSLLAAWAALSATFATNPAWSVYQLPRVAEAILVFVYIANHVRSEADTSFVVACLATAVAVTGAVGLLQQSLGSSFDLQSLGGTPELLQETYGRAAVSRVSGLLGHANTAAFFLAASLPVVLMSSVGARPATVRNALLLAAGLGFLTLVLTFSRGGWVAFAFGSFVSTVLLVRRRRNLPDVGRLAGRAIALVAVCVVMAIPFASQVASRLMRDDYGSIRSRIELAQTALEMIGRNPWTGVGLNNYRFVVLDYNSSPGVNVYGVAEPVHNAYLKTAAELGIPAALVLCYALAAFLWHGLAKSGSSDSRPALLAIGLVGGLAAAYLHGMFEWISLGEPQFLLVTLMGGLAVGLVETGGVARTPRGPSQRVEGAAG